MLRVRAWMVMYALLTAVLLVVLACALAWDWFWALTRNRRYATRA